MKAILPILCAVALLAGCKTVTKEDACAAAITAYTVYLAVINADGHPSADQIVAATAAASVLQTQCGWSNPVRKLVAIDQYGVPKLLPPK